MQSAQLLMALASLRQIPRVLLLQLPASWRARRQLTTIQPRLLKSRGQARLRPHLQVVPAPTRQPRLRVRSRLSATPPIPVQHLLHPLRPPRPSQRLFRRRKQDNRQPAISGTARSPEADLLTNWNTKASARPMRPMEWTPKTQTGVSKPRSQGRAISSTAPFREAD